MARFWSIYFMSWAALAVALCLAAPSLGWWFPETGVAMSTIGRRIDGLFYIILWITSIVFVGTQIALGYVLWKGAVKPPGEKATYTHGNHTLEVVWTVIPGIVLLFIAIYQMDVWAAFRMRNFAPGEIEAIAEVTARQFEWRIRYPAPGKPLMPTPQPDDLYTVNDLRIPVGRPVSISLRSGDVQHSFFVPVLRIKQDALPGTVIPVWFDALEPGSYDLVCAELCGWGHYKMKARVLAAPDEEFRAWKKQALARQADDGVAKTEVAPTEIAPETPAAAPAP